MGSVSSTNPGVADLLQTLSKVGSPLASSSKDVSALEKASPADLVQLSTAAMQLENVDTLFGGTTGANAGSRVVHFFRRVFLYHGFDFLYRNHRGTNAIGGNPEPAR